ncbi:MAG: class I SAM-dependent methyltransferase [Promethearchaeota archaeon]
MRTINKPKGYGPKQAKIYEKVRQATLADVLFWKKEVYELLQALQLSKLKDPKILEAGCGTGRFMPYLAKNGYLIHGTDLSKYMIAMAQGKSRKSPEHYAFSRADISHLPFLDGVFDFVYSIRVMNQLPSKDFALHAILELCRVSTENGSILVEYVNEWGLSRFSRRPSTFVSIRDLKNILKHENCKIEYVHGVLFFSQSLWKRLPRKMLHLLVKFDGFLCTLLPFLSTRCFVYISKK